MKQRMTKRRRKSKICMQYFSKTASKVALLKQRTAKSQKGLCGKNFMAEMAAASHTSVSSSMILKAPSVLLEGGDSAPRRRADVKSGPDPAAMAAPAAPPALVALLKASGITPAPAYSANFFAAAFDVLLIECFMSSTFRYKDKKMGTKYNIDPIY